MYNPNNKLIYDQVSINDVGRALKSSSGDLWTLGHNKNINMWSKHKPVDWNGEDYPQEKFGEDWYKGLHQDCGINTIDAYLGTTGLTRSTFTSIYDGKNNGWKYVNNDTKIRLQDFENYSGTAYPLYHNFKFPKKVYKGSSDSVLNINFEKNDDIEYCLVPEDIKLRYSEFNEGILVSEMYVGIAAFRSGSTSPILVVSKTPNQTSITLDPNQLLETTYTVYPFLVSQSEQDQAGAHKWSLPGVAPFELKVTNDYAEAIGLHIDVTVISNKKFKHFGYRSIKLRLVFWAEEEITITNCNLRWMLQGNNGAQGDFYEGDITEEPFDMTLSFTRSYIKSIIVKAKIDDSHSEGDIYPYELQFTYKHRAFTRTTVIPFDAFDNPNNDEFIE